jgi:16S rRNA (uracil1498-N3)-methyltransferase
VRTTRVLIDFSSDLQAGDEVDLPAETAHHLITVLRLRESQSVRLFNGRGSEWEATLLAASKKRCRARLTMALPPVAAPFPLEICLALIKGDGFDRAIQKSVELGVAAIRLLQTEYTTVRRDAVQDEKRMDHLRRIIVAACEQSGGRYLPQLHAPVPLAQCLGTAAHDGADAVSVLVFDPSGEPLPLTLPRQRTLLLTGPEGGWSPDELHQVRNAGVCLHCLGSQVLKAETAPLVALAAVKHGWGWRD